MKKILIVVIACIAISGAYKTYDYYKEKKAKQLQLSIQKAQEETKQIEFEEEHFSIENLTKSLTIEEAKAQFGDNIKSQNEKGFVEATLYEGTKNQVLIQFRNDGVYYFIQDAESKWRVPLLKIGQTLAEIENVNRRPHDEQVSNDDGAFNFWGFEWEDGGIIMNWGSARLSQYVYPIISGRIVNTKENYENIIRSINTASNRPYDFSQEMIYGPDNVLSSIERFSGKAAREELVLGEIVLINYHKYYDNMFSLEDFKYLHNADYNNVIRFLNDKSYTLKAGNGDTNSGYSIMIMDNPQTESGIRVKPPFEWINKSGENNSELKTTSLKTSNHIYLSRLKDELLKDGFSLKESSTNNTILENNEGMKVEFSLVKQDENQRRRDAPKNYEIKFSS